MAQSPTGPMATGERRLDPEEGSLLSYDPRKLLVIFLRRARTFAAVSAATMAGVLVVASEQPRTYGASANLLVQPQQTDVMKTTQGGAPSASEQGLVDTQVQLLGSPEIASRVADKLNLYADPEFNPALKAANAGPPTAELRLSSHDQVVANILGHVQSRRAGLTYVITVTARSKSANKAAEIANAFAQAFIQAQLDAKHQVSNDASGYLNGRLSNLQNEVQAADAAVQNYKIAHNLTSASGATMAEQEVSSLNQQIAAARAEAAEKQARLNAAQSQLRQGGGGEDVGAALGSETIRSLRAQEAQASSTLADLETRYGPKHPTVQKAQNQLTDVRIQIQAEIKRILSSLQADVQVANERVSSLTASQGGARGALSSNASAQVGLLELQRKADAARAVYEAFLNRSKENSAQEGIQQADARIVSQAQPSNVPVTPNMKLAAALGVVLALALGVAAIILLEMLDRSLRTSIDVEDSLGIAYAGGIPTPESTGKVKLADRRLAPQDYLLKNPFSSFAEAFRSLKTHLLLTGEEEAVPKTIAITSALPKEGKSVTSFCLMRTLAQAGTNVLLIDCDLRRRGVSQFIGERPVGLVDVLDGRAKIDDALVPDEASGGWVLPVREMPSSPKDYLSMPEMDTLLAAMRERFDLVILDTPPTLALADARTVAAKCDRTLFLAYWGKTPRRAVEAALGLLLESGANIAGVALTRVDMRKQASTGYGDYGYYYKAYRSYYSG